MNIILRSTIPSLILLLSVSFGQVYTMQDGVEYTCSGSFYDDGEAAGNYSNNQQATMSFCAVNGGQMRVSFSNFRIEAGFDSLLIWDGPAPLPLYSPGNIPPGLVVYWGTNSPGEVTSSGSCLTFYFSSDGSINDQGWESTLSCICPDDDNDGQTSIACGGLDCDDNDGNVYDGAVEICDGKDTDCDGAADFPGELINADGDPSPSCNDCNESDPSIYVNAPEILCDGVDQDCDGDPYECEILMPDGLTFYTCTGQFYDNGGPAGNYFNNTTSTVSICSNNEQNVRVSFSNFEIEAGFDSLIVWNGVVPLPPYSPGNIPPGLQVFWGSNNPGIQTSSGQCLSFKFSSDGSINLPGWIAEISCLDACQDADNDGYDAIECGGTDCNDNDPNIYPGVPDAVCNGMDDDCDGQIDEDYVSQPVNCGGIGVCAGVGFTHCLSGIEAESCTTGGEPGPEMCNGLDDDCDGSTDEDFPSLGNACDGGDSDVCQDGTLVCSGDGLSVICDDDPASIAEVCNNLDDDCDGSIDEDFPNLGNACDGGDSDECQDGTLVCSADGLSEICDDDPASIVETCNGLDDDCDGSIDEDFPNLGNACDGGDSDECQDGTLVCSGDGLSVICDDDPASIAETCNGLDDDCDGSIDEDFPSLGNACDGGDLDDCQDGIMVCSADGLSEICDDDPASIAETCNGLDDDCDGVIDNGLGIDQDQDGHYDPASCQSDETVGDPFDDCDDTEPAIYPSAVEICGDGIDSNCNCPGGTDFITGECGDPSADDDGDGLSFIEEQIWNTSDCDLDSDDDGIDDGTEVNIYLGYIDPANPDTDEDGLTDGEEILQYGTSAFDSDTDNDGLLDGEEVHDYLTSPIDFDSDDDALGDGAEVNEHFTEPLHADSDDDMLQDGTELGIVSGHPVDTNPTVFIPDADNGVTVTNPNNPDTDSGGIPDGNEDMNCNGAIEPGECDPQNPADDFLMSDADEDGYSIIQGDCDDENELIHPAADEFCDNIDNDCDGEIDEDFFYVENGTQVAVGEVCGVGICAGGSVICAGPESTTCSGNGNAASESCNGLDDDCDGNVDERWTDLGYPCTEGIGECGEQGEMVCNSAGNETECNASPSLPEAEICDSLDNDCDGDIDEELLPIEVLCGVGECSSAGTLVCVEGILINDCVPGDPIEEICDGLDNDCNELIDDALPESFTECGIGECSSTGTVACVDSNWLDDCVPGEPTEELCDNLDNDCDNQVDEEIPTEIIFCGVGECFRTGVHSCNEGNWVDNCIPGNPSEEICDALDNDCDELIDEDLGFDETICGIGECTSTGILSCVEGDWLDDCTPNSPSQEVCDELDNDCDGSIDNGLYVDCAGICEGLAVQTVCGCTGGETGLEPDFCYGCTNPSALNYNPIATIDDGFCIFPGDCNEDGQIDVSDIVQMIFIILEQ